jgi:putative spermidine/putrescine transport system ATP-binding protein
MKGSAGRVEVVRVTKTFGDTVAVDSVSVVVEPGEFFTLLGPSGSGKTTLLRMIAGFEEPTSGRIQLGDRDVTRLPPFDRDVNTVFQDYALFPHMSVIENVEYGLKVKRVARDQRRTRAGEALDAVRLTGFEDRAPSQLSGGQRQRVALARALVNRPGVLLLDEPLGALDLKLREEMQLELKALQRDVGITFIFVTHDQAEALSMSDRVAVFDRGRVAQIGSPAEIYERPSSAFVAGFVGTSNVLSSANGARLVPADGSWIIRPEHVRIGDDPEAISGPPRGQGTVIDVSYVGSETRYLVRLDAGTSLTVAELNRDRNAAQAMARRNGRVWVGWDDHHLVRLPDDSEIAVTTAQ